MNSNKIIDFSQIRRFKSEKDSNSSSDGHHNISIPTVTNLNDSNIFKINPVENNSSKQTCFFGKFKRASIKAESFCQDEL